VIRSPLPWVVAVWLLGTAPPSPLSAQKPSHERTDPPAQSLRAGGVRPLRIAKWTTLGAGIAAAGYGFAASLAADDRNEQLDRLCAAAPERCVKAPGGGYVDEEVDRIRGETERLDRRARTALIASQLGVAASVTLFLLDLRNVGDPPNIPYGPARLRIEPGRDGVTVTLRLDWP
jgi:hypothetical protein